MYTKRPPRNDRDLAPSDIILEDNHLIVVHKQAGVPVQGDDSGDRTLDEMVKDYIRVKYSKPGEVYLGLIHRLDRPVAGLVAMARTSKAAARMSEMFRERKIEKTYLAIVEAEPKKHQDTLTGYIWKDPEANRAYVNNQERKGAKLATLDYRLLQEMNGAFLLEVKPDTGRPHQIRAQLSHMGCPIVGDNKYGSKVPVKDRSIYLLARRLKFEHPVKKHQVELLSRNPHGPYWQKFDLTQGI